jgi:hypothetical protein
MPRHATKLQGENFSPSKNFSPVFSPMSEVDAAQEFAAVILPFSVGELATATNRSKETAKCWKLGRAFPNGVSLMALVAEFPAIRAWAHERTGGFDSSQSLGTMFALLEKVMASDTAEGRAMRARFQQIAEGR